MARNERFPSSFQLHIQNMIQILVSHVRQKSKDRDTQDESRNANVSIASFIKVSLLIIAHDPAVSSWITQWWTESFNFS